MGEPTRPDRTGPRHSAGKSQPNEEVARTILRVPYSAEGSKDPSSIASFMRSLIRAQRAGRDPGAHSREPAVVVTFTLPTKMAAVAPDIPSDLWGGLVCGENGKGGPYRGAQARPGTSS